MPTWFVALILAAASLAGLRSLLEAGPSWWWLVAGWPVAFVALRVMSVPATIALMALLDRVDRYMDAGRRRRALWTLRAAGAVSHCCAVTTGNSRLRQRYLRKAAHQHADWGRWDDVLRAAGRLARLASGDARVLAYNLMLHALAILGRREAFALAFAALEGLFVEDASPDEARTKGDRASEDRFRPLSHANYLRALLAFRAADFEDALHWTARARQLDPDSLDPLILEADIAGWRDDYDGGSRRLREATDIITRLEPTWREQADLLMRLFDATGAAADDDAARHRAALGRAVDNERWRVAWAHVRLAALTRRPVAIEEALAHHAALGMAHASGHVQVCLGRMMAASLRREGNAAEAPYAEALHAMRRTPVPALLWAEVPFWRAVGLTYRGMFDAALEKWAALDDLPEWVRPPLVCVAREALRAHALERLGRASEGAPHREEARRLAPEGHRIAWVALAPRDRMVARLPAE